MSPVIQIGDNRRYPEVADQALRSDGFSFYPATMPSSEPCLRLKLSHSQRSVKKARPYLELVAFLKQNTVRLLQYVLSGFRISCQRNDISQ